MKQKYGLLAIVVLLCSVLLIACGDGDTTTKAVVKKKSATTLPADFPADFPFPETSVITKVEDDSEGDQGSYSITFDFDPDIDLEKMSDMYKAYSEKLGYTIILGGEEFFAKDIFQFGATDPKSTSNMFVITMRVVDNQYGSIDLQRKK